MLTNVQGFKSMYFVQNIRKGDFPSAFAKIILYYNYYIVIVGYMYF